MRHHALYDALGLPNDANKHTVDVSYIDDFDGYEKQPFDETKIKTILIWNNVSILFMFSYIFIYQFYLLTDNSLLPSQYYHLLSTFIHKII